MENYEFSVTLKSVDNGYTVAISYYGAQENTRRPATERNNMFVAKDAAEAEALVVSAVSGILNRNKEKKAS